MNSVSKVSTSIKNVFERELGTELLPEEKAELEDFVFAVNKKEDIILGYVQIIDDKTIFLRPSLLLGTKTIQCIDISEKGLPPNNAKVRLTGFWKRIPYVINNRYYSSDIFYFSDWEIVPRPKVEVPLSYEEVLEFFVEDMGIDFKDPYLGNKFLYQDALLVNAISSPPVPNNLLGGIYSSISYLNSYKTKAQRALARIKRMLPNTMFKVFLGIKKIEMKYFMLQEAKKLSEQRKLVFRRKKLLNIEPLTELSANFHLSEAKLENFARRRFYGDLSFLLPSTLEVKKDLPTLGKTNFELKSVLYSDKPRLPPNIHIPLYFIAVHINMPIIEKTIINKAQETTERLLSKKLTDLNAELVGKDKLIDPNKLIEQSVRLGLYLGRKKEKQAISIKEIESGLNQIFTLSDKFLEELSIHEKSGQPKLTSIQATILKVYDKIERSNNRGVRIDDIIEDLSGKVKKDKIEKEIKKMIEKGIFYMPEPGILKLP